MKNLYNYLINNASRIHFFGLGFIQVKTSDRERFHFYLPELPPYVEDPHNHRYDFDSYVLRGYLEQTIYDYSTTAYYPSHNITEVSCNPDKPICRVDTTCTINKRLRVFIAEGSNYTIDKYTFHTVKAHGPAITKVIRDLPSREFAEALIPIGKERICPFSKKYDESYLWELVKKYAL